MRVVRTRRGARLVERDVVLSEILAKPGPTHALFDVLAACVAALAPGPRCAVLGFAGGGMVAPLRAMGFPHGVDAVDLSRAGEDLFRELSSGWAGSVRLTRADAAKWLRRGKTRYHAIVEDLSITGPAGTIKPYASFESLPDLVRARLVPEGVAITNVLPLPGTSWAALLARIGWPHRVSMQVILDEYENRFVVAGDALPPAAEASRRVRARLRAIGSNQERKVAFRTLYRE